jgi:hypothetical protein
MVTQGAFLYRSVSTCELPESSRIVCVTSTVHSAPNARIIRNDSSTRTIDSDDPEDDHNP